MADDTHAPETPTASAAQAPPETDALARDLPGLPFETKRLRADERGVLVKPWLGRREEFVPWSEIVGHRWRRFDFTLDRQRPDECEVGEVAVPAGRAARRVIRTAWREYVLRMIERDGVLRGSHVAVRRGLDIAAAWSSGLCALPVILNAHFLFASVLYEPLPLGARSLVALVASCCLFSGLFLLVAPLEEGALGREALLNWYRWELSRDGLTYWPSAERKTLVASCSDTVLSGWAKMSTVLVPFSHLTCAQQLEPLLLASLARAHARWPVGGWMRRPRGALEMAACILAAVAGVASVGALDRVGRRGDIPPMLYPAIAAVVGAALVATIYLRHRRRRARSIADGRAMLERLGW